MKTRKEIRIVDNYIITTCIALISASIILVSAKKPANELVAYSITISIFCLIMTLLCSLWHKVRFSYLSNIFEEGSKRIRDKYSEKVTNLFEKALDPLVKLELLKIIPKALPELKGEMDLGKLVEALSKTKLIKVSDPPENETDEKNNSKFVEFSDALIKKCVKNSGGFFQDTMDSYMSNMATEFTDLDANTFHKPLREKNARVRFYFDQISHHARYGFFLVGMIFFLLSIYLNLLY